MEFDKTKVYTALNADEVKEGSKGYFFDELDSLKHAVEHDYELHTVYRIRETDYMGRFEDVEKHEGRALFYLVEEPKEKTFRPYKDTAEMSQDFLKKCGISLDAMSSLFMPNIWLKRKESNEKVLITDMDSYVVYLDVGYSMMTLLDEYTYLDGSPCGMEE